MIGMGINPTAVRTSTEGPEFALGTRMLVAATDGTGEKEYVYVKDSGAGITGAGYGCLFGGTYNAIMASLTTSAPGQGAGKAYGVALAAIAASGYGWLQVKGLATVRTLASAVAGTILNTTATVGVLDDDAGAGAEVIEGLTLGTATGGAEANNATAFLSNPTVGRTL